MFLVGLYPTMKIYDGICTLGATDEVSECRGKAKQTHQSNHLPQTKSSQGISPACCPRKAETSDIWSRSHKDDVLTNECPLHNQIQFCYPDRNLFSNRQQASVCSVSKSVQLRLWRTGRNALTTIHFHFSSSLSRSKGEKTVPVEELVILPADGRMNVGEKVVWNSNLNLVWIVLN